MSETDEQLLAELRISNKGTRLTNALLALLIVAVLTLAASTVWSYYRTEELAREISAIIRN